MPGAFAHMIAAKKARNSIRRRGLDRVAPCVLFHTEYMQAGTVGPDYPYLHHLKSHDDSDKWADLFHIADKTDVLRTGEVVKVGVKWLHDHFHLFEDANEETRNGYRRQIAWLAGYLSHVVLDASIHPVVRAIVGDYEENSTEHRICEMYMDSFIFKKEFGYELANDEWVDYLRHTTDPVTGGMDRAIKELWGHMIEQVFPNENQANPPAFDGWHRNYISAVDAADARIILFRHVATENGFLYADSDQIPADKMEKYISHAKTPSPNQFGKEKMAYEDVFEFGVENVIKFWSLMDEAIAGTGELEIPNWNLDTGTLDAKGDGNATLWI